MGKFKNIELKSFSIERSVDKATSQILGLVLSLNLGFTEVDFIKKFYFIIAININNKANIYCFNAISKLTLFKSDT